ncbi:MAG: hypothetical protein RR814_01630, partial [Oscillospiraceae bacterium]
VFFDSFLETVFWISRVSYHYSSAISVAKPNGAKWTASWLLVKSAQKALMQLHEGLKLLVC